MRFNTYISRRASSTIAETGRSGSGVEKKFIHYFAVAAAAAAASAAAFSTAANGSIARIS